MTTAELIHTGGLLAALVVLLAALAVIVLRLAALPLTAAAMALDAGASGITRALAPTAPPPDPAGGA
ncbi:hypothetical protein [Nocardiopsis halophila]|uniref:hypothetical protein n=1 Tax=Nocardiopsis halophila TaxID=141692 RepID=UPI00034A001B|nr:hypothetical protein [Nocardiopsis halophila]